MHEFQLEVARDLPLAAYADSARDLIYIFTLVRFQFKFNIDFLFFLIFNFAARLCQCALQVWGAALSYPGLA